MQSFGNHQIPAFVPACLIENQKDALVWPNPLLFGEGSKSKRKGGSVDGRHEQPGCLATLRLDKPIQVHPLIARPHNRWEATSFACPNPSQDGFESDPVLVLTPEVNPGFWVSLADLVDLLGQFF